VWTEYGGSLIPPQCKVTLEPTTSISKYRASSRALFARYRQGAASVDYGMLFKTVTHTHQGIWSSHLSTCLSICIYIYHTTSSNQSRDQIRLVSRPTLSVLKHYHVVQGNSPNIPYSQTIANLKKLTGVQSLDQRGLL
jgi:hypothetical protein